MFGVFAGVVVISIAKQFDSIENTSNSKQNITDISTGRFLVGVGSVLWCSWMFSGVSILTRKLKEIHFSLMMFHYGWFATSALLGCLIV